MSTSCALANDLTIRRLLAGLQLGGRRHEVSVEGGQQFFCRERHMRGFDEQPWIRSRFKFMHEARSMFMVTTPELVPLYIGADRCGI